MKKSFLNRETYFLLFFLIVGLLLRIWNYYNLFYFAIDEEKAAYIIKGIANATHFPTVGHPSSIGFRLGPLLYYLVAPFYKIFGSHPIIWGYVSVATSIVSMILIYKIGRRISVKSAFIALFLYCFSYLTILYDRRGWQVSFHFFLSLFILFCLLKIKEGYSRYCLILTFALIACSQFEVATILFIPLTLIAIRLFHIRIPPKKFIFYIFLFIVSQAGLLFFDIRHNFINTKYLINYFTHSGTERIQENIPLIGVRNVYFMHNILPNTLARTLYPSRTQNVAIEYANCPQYLQFKHSQIPFILKLLTIATIFIFILFTLKRWNTTSMEEKISKFIFLYIFIIVGSTSVYTYLFHGEMAEYYFLPFFPYFFLIIGILLNTVLNKNKYTYPFIVIIFIVFCYVNIQELILATNPYGLSNKEKAVQFILAHVKDKPFTVYAPQTCWNTGGYRYLFSYYGKNPVQSYMDQYLSEYYTTIPDRKTSIRVTILTPELIGDQPKEYQLFVKTLKAQKTSAQFGAIEVDIEENNFDSSR